MTASTPGSLWVEGFFDPATGTISYLVLDRASRHAALIDTVLDYDPKSGRTDHTSADRLLSRVKELDVQVQWILETHVHADHLSAAPYLKQALGGRTGIGRHITTVQQVFGDLFNAGADFARDGRQFDHLFADGETFPIGQLTAEVMHTPGHTPACLSYVVRDGQGPDGAAAEVAAFVGDTLFMPDYGTARCDFPGGDARTLYRSIQRVLGLPPHTRLYMCHDYQPGGRELRFVSTVAEQHAHNVHVHHGISEDDFVAMRQARDAGLDMPTLILPSVQINMRAGALPEPESNGTRYIKIPLNAL
jgi:glyoxylase-like metal-dependent hydrolase (beta-lactamase superfamily II)